MKTLKNPAFIFLLSTLACLFISAGCSNPAENTQQIAMQDTLRTDCESDPCGACNNDERYPSMNDGGGVEIAPNVGKEFVLGFHNDHRDIICGGFISKVALDSIFCHHQDYNGLYAYIATDGTGKQMIVIEGFRQETNGECPVKVTFDSSLPDNDRYKTFMTQTMCPTMCGYCGD